MPKGPGLQRDVTYQFTPEALPQRPRVSAVSRLRLSVTFDSTRAAPRPVVSTGWEAAGPYNYQTVAAVAAVARRAAQPRDGPAAVHMVPVVDLAQPELDHQRDGG